MLRTLVDQTLPAIAEKHGLNPEDIDWFLPHYSSHYFRQPLFDHLREIDFVIPEERWFTNLAAKGNTGSASFYIMLEELFASGRLRKGERNWDLSRKAGGFRWGGCC